MGPDFIAREHSVSQPADLGGGLLEPHLSQAGSSVREVGPSLPCDEQLVLFGWGSDGPGKLLDPAGNESRDAYEGLAELTWESGRRRIVPCDGP